MKAVRATLRPEPTLDRARSPRSPAAPAPSSSPAAPTSSTTSSSASPRPTLLVDVSRLPLGGRRAAAATAGCGSAPRSATATSPPHPGVRARLPACSPQALLAGASGQIRNLATTGGNLLQRTRCVYFQDVTTPCNKREPGTRLLRAARATTATTPSSAPPRLRRHAPLRPGRRPGRARRGRRACSAPTASAGSRWPTCTGCPATDPELDTTLPHGELITAVELPPLRPARRSTYRKVRDRASYAFALVSVAAALDVDDGVVRDVRHRAAAASRTSPGGPPAPRRRCAARRLTEDAVPRGGRGRAGRRAAAAARNAFKVAAGPQRDRRHAATALAEEATDDRAARRPRRVGAPALDPPRRRRRQGHRPARVRREHPAPRPAAPLRWCSRRSRAAGSPRSTPPPRARSSGVRRGARPPQRAPAGRHLRRRAGHPAGRPGALPRPDRRRRGGRDPGGGPEAAALVHVDVRRGRRTTSSCARDRPGPLRAGARSTRRTRPTPTRATSRPALRRGRCVVDADLHDADRAQQPDGAARHASPLWDASGRG